MLTKNEYITGTSADADIYIYQLMAQFSSPFTSITAHPRVELACCSSMRRGCGCITYVVVENKWPP